MSETKRLGRGLEALLGAVSRDQAEASGSLRELPIGNVVPNPYQPRTHVDEAGLTELTASIEASGLLQPVIVRPKNGKFELIAGERRWRAIQRLGWAKIPGGHQRCRRSNVADARSHRKSSTRRSELY